MSHGRLQLGSAAGWAWVAGLVVLAAVLRFNGADHQLWYDEIKTLVGSVRAPLAVIVTHFPSNNDHVLYSLLAHLSIAAGGDTPLMLRLPAVLFGIISIPLIYLLGTEVTNRYEALSAALLATVSAHHIWFSQNARGYTLLLAVALLTTWLLLVGLRTRARWPFALYALVAALGCYTHLTMVLAVIAQAVPVALHLVARDGGFRLAGWRGPVIAFGGAGVLTILLYLPLLGDVHAFFGDPSTSPKAATAGWALLELARNLDFGGPMLVALGAVGTVFAIGAASYGRQSPLVLALFLLPAATVYLTALAMGRPTFPRFFFFIAGFLLLIGVRGVAVIIETAAAALGGGLRRHAGAAHVAALGAMAAILIFDLSRTYLRPKQDYDGALAFVERSARPGDRIALGENGVNFPYTAYYGRNWPLLERTGDLDRLRAGGDVWVLRTFDRYLKLRNPALVATLDNDCELAAKFSGTLADGDIRVFRCAVRPA